MTSDPPARRANILIFVVGVLLMGNQLAWPMTDGAIVTIEMSHLYAPRPDSLLVLAALLLGAGFALHWNSKRATGPISTQEV